MRLRAILLLGFLAALTVAADSAKRSATKGESVLRVETRLVEVNVVAHDSKGKAVTDLRRDEFTVFDNGKKVPIDVFSAIRIEGTPSLTPLPANTFSNRIGLPSATVILLDGLNTSFEDQTWARTEVVRFLEELDPQDRVAIYLLGDHLIVLENFTSEPKVLLQVVKNAKSRLSWELAASTPPELTPGTRAFNAQTSQEDMMARFEQFESSFFILDRVYRTMDALTAIANYLTEFPGRKNLIWVSAAFPLSIGGAADPKNLGPEFQRAARALDNASVAVYPVDARGLVAPGAPGVIDESIGATHSTMDELADYTGGRAFYNTNDLAVPMRRAADDSRADYTLGFYPHTRWDGRYHNLKVKANRPGVHLGHRRGYYASLGPAASEDQTSTSLSQAIMSPLDTTSLGLTVSIEQRVEKPARRFKLRITADAHSITFRNNKGGKAAGLDFIFAQLDPWGKIVSDVRHMVTLGIADKDMDVVLARGVSLNDLLEVTPGATQLRLIVRDSASGNMGSVTLPLGH
jgi:VWFA-related protein